MLAPVTKAHDILKGTPDRTTDHVVVDADHQNSIPVSPHRCIMALWVLKHHNEKLPGQCTHCILGEPLVTCNPNEVMSNQLDTVRHVSSDIEVLRLFHL